MKYMGTCPGEVYVSDIQNRHVSRQQKKPGLHDPNSLREEAKPKPLSLGPVAPTGGQKREQCHKEMQ